MNDRKENAKPAMLGRKILQAALGIAAVTVIAFSAMAGVALETLAIGTPKTKGDKVNVGVYVVNSSGTGQQNPAALVQSEIRYNTALFRLDADTVKAAGTDGKLAAYSDSSIIKYNNDAINGVLKISYCEATLGSAIPIASNDACVFSFVLELLKDNAAGTCELGSSNQKFWNFSGSAPAKAYDADDLNRTTKYSMKGDVNHDNATNSSDALKILEYEVGIPTSDLSQREVQIGDVDMDEDGCSNSNDALWILEYEVGIRESL